jgi:flavodoxin I
MKILFIYGSYSTGTLLVCEQAKKQLDAMGYSTNIVEANIVEGSDILEQDLIIMASPSWKVEGKQGMPHEYFLEMMTKLHGQVFNKKFAVISLGDAQYSDLNGSARHLESYVQELGGTLVGEPLKIEGFFNNQESCIEQIANWIPSILA